MNTTSQPSAPRVYTEAEVRAAVSMTAAIESARQAFVAVARGTVENPPPWHLDVTTHDGEVHVKGAFVTGSPIFAIKTSTGFSRNAGAGLPTSSGFSSVFDAATGALRAVLLDNGYLTELRTGAAGALALDLLAPNEIETVCIIGTGGQARFQVEGVLAVRKPHRILFVGRDAGRAEAFAGWARDRTDAEVVTSTDIEASVRQADAIVTVTTSRVPLVQREWVRPGTHLTAVGSDGPGKRELSPRLLEAADLVVADDLEQSRRLGELQDIADSAMQHPAVSLGSVLVGTTPGRGDDTELTVADLSGLGVQDATVAEAALGALEGNGSPAQVRCLT